ncbi:unnamed protein product [Lactuca virosa]|uniref:Uncharacterized protein n=1 Tax=Lactuca virosa TaxID=75947 RepID=A0AAU9MV47_9ASTR|nr:unnamed protein product [Lactuca virosa]
MVIQQFDRVGVDRGRRRRLLPTFGPIDGKPNWGRGGWFCGGVGSKQQNGRIDGTVTHRRSVADAQIGRMKEKETKAIGWLGVAIVYSSFGEAPPELGWTKGKTRNVAVKRFFFYSSPEVRRGRRPGERFGGVCSIGEVRGFDDRSSPVFLPEVWKDQQEKEKSLRVILVEG